MMTLGAVARADDSFHDLMILLIHDLKLSRPKRNEFVNILDSAAFRSGAASSPTNLFVPSSLTMSVRFHISEEGLLSTLRTWFEN